MKILVITQRYWPESFRITDISEALVEKGHQVTVLTGLPMYPKGIIFNDYKNGKKRNEIHNGVNVIRVKEIERRNNFFNRLLNYYSYPFYAKKMIKKLKQSFDVILINELSPIMCAYPGILYKKMHGTKIIMYEMDLWPESLLAGGIKKNSIMYKHYKKVSAKIYSSCDKILVSTKEHINYIHDLPNCKNVEIEYLPQYAELLFEKMTVTNKCDDVIDLMFAGNIGKAQTIQTIVKAASLLQSNSKIKFHIVGDGSELENVKKMVDQLKINNVIFYGHKPLEDMPNLYKMADAMLVCLENKTYANMTIPGKVQSYMAAGKPIIGIANGSCANFIKNNQIGYSVSSENIEELVELINHLDLYDLAKIGAHAKNIYLTKYSREKFVINLLNDLEHYSEKK